MCEYAVNAFARGRETLHKNDERVRGERRPKKNVARVCEETARERERGGILEKEGVGRGLEKEEVVMVARGAMGSDSNCNCLVPCCTKYFVPAYTAGEVCS